MKLTTKIRKGNTGFTLIEMIGVLAVIAILAAVLIPKVFSAINNARVNNAAMSIQTAKTACVDHYSKYGGILAGPNGTTYTPGTNYDTSLLAEGFLEKPFLVRIGDGSGARLETVDISSAVKYGADVAPGVDDQTGFALAGYGATNDVTGSVMVVAKITGVEVNDAKDLNDRIDGTSMGAAITADDKLGRVKYAKPTAPATTTDVYVYLTHR